MLRIEPLGEHIGAEVCGVNLCAPLAPDDVRSLESALLEHLVLVVRGQTLTATQYRDALANFGPPMHQHRARYNLEQCPEVSQVVNRDGFPPAVNWHTDHTNHERPPKITSLYGVQIPASGGDTAFANMYMALQALPAHECEQLARRFTLNSMESDPSYSAADRARHPGGVRHPMVRLHPQTGRGALYFHVSKSQGIEGMPDAEVRPYLESLLERSIAPAYVYRHRWQAGDVVICDNRATMHRVYADYHPEDYRLLWRVIIEGDRPRGLH